MAANIANIQLTVLQAPQVAQNQMPGLLQAELANAQAPALIRRQDEEEAETVQDMEGLSGNRVGDALSGNGQRYGSGSQKQRRQPEGESVRKPAPHPLGIGALIDIQV